MHDLWSKVSFPVSLLGRSQKRNALLFSALRGNHGPIDAKIRLLRHLIFKKKQHKGNHNANLRPAVNSTNLGDI